MNKRVKRHTNKLYRLSSGLTAFAVILVVSIIAGVSTKFADAATVSGTVYVSENGNDNNTGITPSSPFRTIQKAFQSVTAYQPLVINMLGSQYDIFPMDPSLPKLSYVMTVGSTSKVMLKSATNKVKVRIYSGSEYAPDNLIFNVYGSFSVSQLKFDNIGLQIKGKDKGKSQLTYNVFDLHASNNVNNYPQNILYAGDSSTISATNNVFNVMKSPGLNGYCPGLAVDGLNSGQILVTTNTFNMPAWKLGDEFLTYAGIAPARAYGKSLIDIAKNTFKTVGLQSTNPATSSVGIIQGFGKYLTGKLIIRDDNDFRGFHGVPILPQQF